jgi:hypothetical protein
VMWSARVVSLGCLKEQNLAADDELVRKGL